MKNILMVFILVNIRWFLLAISMVFTLSLDKFKNLQNCSCSFNIQNLKCYLHLIKHSFFKIQSKLFINIITSECRWLWLSSTSCLLQQCLFFYCPFLFIFICSSLSFLSSICLVGVKFSYATFFIICPRNVSHLFLFLTIKTALVLKNSYQNYLVLHKHFFKKFKSIKNYALFTVKILVCFYSVSCL